MQAKLQNIAATADGLYEYEAEKVLVFIPKEEIRKLRFGFESPVRLPILSIVIGVLLIAAGIIFGVVPLIEAIASQAGNFLYLKGYALISLQILFGTYFLSLGLRKKFCLILDTPKGRKKLVFKEPVTEEKVLNFLNESAARFEYPVITNCPNYSSKT